MSEGFSLSNPDGTTNADSAQFLNTVPNMGQLPNSKVPDQTLRMFLREWTWIRLFEKKLDEELFKIPPLKVIPIPIPEPPRFEFIPPAVPRPQQPRDASLRGAHDANDQVDTPNPTPAPPTLTLSQRVTIARITRGLLDDNLRFDVKVSLRGADDDPTNAPPNEGNIAQGTVPGNTPENDPSMSNTSGGASGGAPGSAPGPSGGGGSSADDGSGTE